MVAVVSNTKTKYSGVYRDAKGKYFYNIFLGRDLNGKQKFKKGRVSGKKLILRQEKRTMIS